MFNRLGKTYHSFPGKFWIVVGVSFIDGIGRTLLFPFFSLYITQKFGVGMTTAGIILGIFSISGLLGNMLGGALTDRFGRRLLILFGLILSALSSLSLGLVNTLIALYPLSIFSGLFSNIAAPAHQAMVADILPEEKRSEGFGILRVAGNLSWLIGPTIGGFLATRSLPIGSTINEFLTTHPFFLLFVMDVVISCSAALLFYLYIPETKSMPLTKDKQENMFKIFTGYFCVLQDGSFMAFILAAILMDLVYLQMYNSLSVYLRDNHGIDPQGYGFLMSASAITVILFQFWISSVIKRRPPFLMLALGALFYMLGFSMFGLVLFNWLFILAVVVITFGEMLVMPTSQVLTAHFAPEEMRGRYIAVFSLVWMIPSVFGPGLAGIILDNYNPNLLWYIGGVLCAGSSLSFYVLHLRLGKQERFAPTPIEEGQLAGLN